MPSANRMETESGTGEGVSRSAAGIRSLYRSSLGKESLRHLGRGVSVISLGHQFGALRLSLRTHS